MINEEKAREIAAKYRANLADCIDFDVYDLDTAESETITLTLEMAEWKDQQFKEYLENKRDLFNKVAKKWFSTKNPEMGVIPKYGWSVINEIINELFKED